MCQAKVILSGKRETCPYLPKYKYITTRTAIYPTRRGKTTIETTILCTMHAKKFRRKMKKEKEKGNEIVMVEIEV